MAEAGDRLSIPVIGGVENVNLYSAAEYTGGYDDVTIATLAGAVAAEVTIYYQTTSREYIEFLRNEINGTATTLGVDNYIVLTNPWFAQLAAWGETIWNLWLHNRDLTTAAPYPVAAATIGATPPPCNAPVPSLDSAIPANQQVTLNWSAGAGTTGYRVYYDQQGKELFIADVGSSTTYTDTNLSNGMPYCYKVRSYDTTCESDFSNVACATPNPTGHLTVSVQTLTAGTWVTTGKGQNSTMTIVTRSDFVAGDEIVFRGLVVDETGTSVQGAVIDILLSGPKLAQLTTGPSDIDGIAAVSWQTLTPNKKGIGGTVTGTYTATVTAVTAGYNWDGVQTSIAITLQ